MSESEASEVIVRAVEGGAFDEDLRHYAFEKRSLLSLEARVADRMTKLLGREAAVLFGVFETRSPDEEAVWNALRARYVTEILP